MIGGLFGPDSSDSDDGEREGVAAESDESIELAGTPVVVRACAYHPQNANKVWPGTYSFASWLAERWDALPLGDGQRVLELGAATGALSAWLAMRGCSVASSDIDDGDVVHRCGATFALNGVQDRARHVPHTWGEPVPPSLLEPPFPLILAVDVLLYTPAYPALIRSLQALLEPRGGVKPRLLMNWERRFKGADDAFFDELAAAGLECFHLGSRVFDISATASRLPPILEVSRGGRG
mmetsp:Transcript_24342/g.76054  ORF Transcript_24342/g.76054 Transcript_24342/m.76054 type:complete len:237 (+) Transcript_24342:884-1594(+)